MRRLGEYEWQAILALLPLPFLHLLWFTGDRHIQQCLARYARLSLTNNDRRIIPIHACRACSRAYCCKRKLGLRRNEDKCQHRQFVTCHHRQQHIPVVGYYYRWATQILFDNIVHLDIPQIPCKFTPTMSALGQWRSLRSLSIAENSDIFREMTDMACDLILPNQVETLQIDNIWSPYTAEKQPSPSIIAPGVTELTIQGYCGFRHIGPNGSHLLHLGLVNYDATVHKHLDLRSSCPVLLHVGIVTSNCSRFRGYISLPPTITSYRFHSRMSPPLTIAAQLPNLVTLSITDMYA